MYLLLTFKTLTQCPGVREGASQPSALGDSLQCGILSWREAMASLKSSVTYMGRRKQIQRTHQRKSSRLGVSVSDCALIRP